MSSNHDLDEILDPSLDSTGSVSYGTGPPLDDHCSHSEADPDIPMCQRCDCEKCKKLQERAKKSESKHSRVLE
jgi:hypothetical protein